MVGFHIRDIYRNYLRYRYIDKWRKWIVISQEMGLNLARSEEILLKYWNSNE